MSSATPEARPSLLDRWGRRGTAIVVGLVAVVLLLVGATVGLVLGGPSSSGDQTLVRPSANSVDVGFLRDMSTHHEQGVLMAHIVQGLGASTEVAKIAYDIEYQQTSQIGQMGGFLQLWDYSLNSLDAPMSWMTDTAGMTGMNGHAMAADELSVDPAAAADGAIMPGMATNTEIKALQALRGDAADVDFLQLMLRHHQGGLPMMQYAAARAVNPVVQNMASKMVTAQQQEITVLTTMLADSGASPLPAPGGAASASSGSTTTLGSGAVSTLTSASRVGEPPDPTLSGGAAG